MHEFVKVARVEDIPENAARCFEVEGRQVGVFNVAGEILAIDDICTHAHAHLSEGEIIGDEVMCPLHFATFNLRSGECTGPPADEDVQTYPVRIEDGDIYIAVG